MSLVSIIVPVYNSSKYLIRAVDSILSQTYSYFELLLVDDGSFDGSEFICDSYAKKDKRVIVYHLSNNGPSAARNYGLTKAKGEYICFVDSDDYIENDYLDKLMSFKEYDLVICKSIFVYDGKNDRNINSTNSYIECKKPFPIMPLLKQYDFFSPFNKLFNREMVEKNKILFPVDLHYGEDAVFTSTYISNISSFICLDYYGYHYFKWADNSLSSKVRNNLIDELFMSRDIFYHKIVEVIEDDEKPLFEIFIKSEKVLGASLFYSKSFYNKDIKIRDRVLLIRSIQKTNFFKLSLLEKKTYYQGIMSIIVMIKGTYIKIFVFKILHTVNTLLKKGTKSY